MYCPFGAVFVKTRQPVKLLVQTFNRINPWFDAGLNFFFPAVCQICKEERASHKEGYVCNSCRQGKGGVQFAMPPFCQRCGFPFEGAITNMFECGNCSGVELHFSTARSAVITTPLVQDVIHRYKYGRSLWFEPFLAELLNYAAAPVLRAGHWDFIVPVPLHPVKLREREFNQAERLAAQLSRAINVPVNTKLLRRVKPTQTQTQLTREQRAANVRGAFEVIGSKKLNGEKIILLDDVFTTGATTGECARVLRRSGAGEICVWTVSRGGGVRG